jgi:hypothetical protein
MSDSHNRWENLKSAIEWVNELDCEFLLFAGDLLDPKGLDYLADFQGQIKAVFGNNQHRKNKLKKIAQKYDDLSIEGEYCTGKFDQLNIFMTHRPLNARQRAKSGDFDLCIYGHTHEYNEEIVYHTRVLCPGEIAGRDTGEISFAIVNTRDLNIERYIL